jgi:hypothetical protein
MGTNATGPTTTVVAAAITALIVVLDAFLVIRTFAG